MQPLHDLNDVGINKIRCCKLTCRFEIDIGVGTADSIVDFNSTLDISNHLHSDKINSSVFVENTKCSFVVTLLPDMHVCHH